MDNTKGTQFDEDKALEIAVQAVLHSGKTLVNELSKDKEIHLEIQSDLPSERLQSLVQRAKKYCFVSNTIIEGCPINIITKSIILSD